MGAAPPQQPLPGVTEKSHLPAPLSPSCPLGAPTLTVSGRAGSGERVTERFSAAPPGAAPTSPPGSGSRARSSSAHAPARAHARPKLRRRPSERAGAVGGAPGRERRWAGSGSVSARAPGLRALCSMEVPARESRPEDGAGPAAPGRGDLSSRVSAGGAGGPGAGSGRQGPAGPPRSTAGPGWPGCLAPLEEDDFRGGGGGGRNIRGEGDSGVGRLPRPPPASPERDGAVTSWLGVRAQPRSQREGQPAPPVPGSAGSCGGGPRNPPQHPTGSGRRFGWEETSRNTARPGRKAAPPSLQELGSRPRRPPGSPTHLLLKLLPPVPSPITWWLGDG